MTQWRPHDWIPAGLIGATMTAAETAGFFHARLMSEPPENYEVMQRRVTQVMEQLQKDDDV